MSTYEKPLVFKTFGRGQVTTEARAAGYNGCEIVARRSANGFSRSARMAFEYDISLVPRK